MLALVPCVRAMLCCCGRGEGFVLRTKILDITGFCIDWPKSLSGMLEGVYLPTMC
jgi:hypothetical protein